MKALWHLLLATTVTLVLCPAVPAQDASAGLAAPIPPAQGTAWTAPATSLPSEILRATEAVFAQGMADPRGCEYREVEIALDYPLKTHAWVLPGNEGQSRHAVGWNGLVYALKSVGASADLAKDLADSAAKWRFRSGVDPFGESYALSTEYVLHLRMAMLLRLGETALAEKYWREGHKDSGTDPQVDPYAEMIAVWLGAWYNTAVRAYLRDDDDAALAICRQVLPVLAQARETARANGLSDPWPERHDGLPFWQMPLLMAEAQRRIDERSRPPAPDPGQDAGEAERIASLVRELDQVRVQQWMTPGQVDVLDDPVAKALVREGGAAVPALLRCLREDQRLTRSRYTGGGWTMESGPIIPVYEVAYTVLFRSLNEKLPVFAHDGGKAEWQERREPRHLSPGDRQALADKLAAIWQKQRDVDPVERAYATLRDDGAGEKAWLQAVDTIVQPTNGQFTDYRLVRPAVGGYSIYPTDRPFTPRGEALRGRTDPTVSELMVRRFSQLSKGEKNSRSQDETDRTGKFLLALAAWDGKAHLDDLRRLQRKLQARFRRAAASPEKEGYGWALSEQAAVLAKLHEARADLGDASALEDYASFLGLLPQRLLGMTDLFRPMWRHPDVPAVVRAADQLFGANSPWASVVRQGKYRLADLAHSRLIAVPAFQQEVLRGLDDTTDAGQVTVQEGGYGDGNGGYSLERDALTPPAGTTIVCRVCDRYAHALAEMSGFPRCELYWPQTERDRAVDASRAFLKRYAGNFRYREDQDKNRDGYSSTPSIRFPALDHPATEEDVRAGRALFSLPPPARVCRLSELPLWADRLDPDVGNNQAKDGAGAPTAARYNRGAVWQAEETLVDGRWERFFGFVDRYGLEKVPAAEMDFPMGRAAGNITPQISGGVNVAPPRTPEEFTFGYYQRESVSRDRRIPTQFRVVNHSGFEQTVPGAVMLPPGAAPGTLPPGLRLILSYSEKMSARTQRYAAPPFNYGTWQDVPPREGVKIASGETPGPSLLPGENGRVVMDVDLRDYFDLIRPGSYRLEAVFQTVGQPASRTDSGVFTVER